MQTFLEYVNKTGFSLIREEIRCMQINVGYCCNLKCSHCHVTAGPERIEMMSWPVMEDVLVFAQKAGISEIDITGGAPEMNPHLPELLQRIRQIPSVKRILLRTNLAILDEAAYERFPELFAQHKVEIVASMPCYLEENLDNQRGRGVHLRNIRVLQRLNGLGYGTKASNLKLNLVYNPLGNFLPGQQTELEAAYKEHLKEIFGISFNTLYTITNMPIGRFHSHLEKQGLLQGYLQLLIDHFNPANLTKVMCLRMISVNWQGRVYDCDFNQILNLPSGIGDSYIGELDPQKLIGLGIGTGSHCFACVAGAGSSCQGSLKQQTG